VEGGSWTERRVVEQISVEECRRGEDRAANDARIGVNDQLDLDVEKFEYMTFIQGIFLHIEMFTGRTQNIYIVDQLYRLCH